MKRSIRSIIIVFISVLVASPDVFAQDISNKVIITGVRFSYPLVNAWIEDYKVANPGSTIQIESRTTTDPTQYDLLLEAYAPDSAARENRDFVYIGQYALLPVANSNAAFAKEFAEKGLTEDLIKQVYFTDIYADKKTEKKITSNYTVYTRLQKAGAPITLAKYYGFEQSQIKGKAIAGADEHLIKALLKDSTAVSYATLGLIYDLTLGRQRNGLTVLPVDLDGNKRLTSEEKIYDNLNTVIERVEAGNLKNIPVEYLHLSISKKNTNAEALQFLHWVLNNGQDRLHEFGFLKPEPQRFQKQKTQLLKELTLN